MCKTLAIWHFFRWEQNRTLRPILFPVNENARKREDALFMRVFRNKCSEYRTSALFTQFLERRKALQLKLQIAFRRNVSTKKKTRRSGFLGMLIRTLRSHFRMPTACGFSKKTFLMGRRVNLIQGANEFLKVKTSTRMLNEVGTEQKFGGS